MRNKYLVIKPRCHMMFTSAFIVICSVFKSAYNYYFDRKYRKYIFHWLLKPSEYFFHWLLMQRKYFLHWMHKPRQYFKIQRIGVNANVNSIWQCALKQFLKIFRTKLKVLGRNSPKFVNF